MAANTNKILLRQRIIAIGWRFCDLRLGCSSGDGGREGSLTMTDATRATACIRFAERVHQAQALHGRVVFSVKEEGCHGFGGWEIARRKKIILQEDAAWEAMEHPWKPGHWELGGSLIHRFLRGRLSQVTPGARAGG
jgi:hypothetical protein